MGLKRPSKQSVTDWQSQSGLGFADAHSHQDSYDMENMPQPKFLNARSQAPPGFGKRFSKMPQPASRGAKSFLMPGGKAPGMQKGNSMMTTAAISLNQREKKRNAMLRKDYRKHMIDYHQKQYQRAFDALVGCTDNDMELVVHGMSSSSFHREAREFLVAKGKYMTDEHLIHLKEDPKTILSLFRIFMLQYKTTIMATIDKAVAPRKKSAGGKQKPAKPVKPMARTASGLSNYNEKEEESDYSDDDFQDLLSNKQIEENIKVFFDRMHELINPIDE